MLPAMVTFLSVVVLFILLYTAWKKLQGLPNPGQYLTDLLNKLLAQLKQFLADLLPNFPALSINGAGVQSLWQFGNDSNPGGGDFDIQTGIGA